MHIHTQPFIVSQVQSNGFENAGTATIFETVGIWEQWIVRFGGCLIRSMVFSLCIPAGTIGNVLLLYCSNIYIVDIKLENHWFLSLQQRGNFISSPLISHQVDGIKSRLRDSSNPTYTILQNRMFLNPLIWPTTKIRSYNGNFSGIYTRCDRYSVMVLYKFIDS